jgi:hypothetical protein
MPDELYADMPQGSGNPGLTPAERHDERYRQRKAFLRSIGLPDARLTRGRPRRNAARRAADRRYYVSKVARANGISEAVAEYLTPKYPNRGRHAMPRRDDAGRFLRNEPGPPGRK